jgi:hypothetical protein
MVSFCEGEVEWNPSHRPSLNRNDCAHDTHWVRPMPVCIFAGICNSKVWSERVFLLAPVHRGSAMKVTCEHAKACQRDGSVDSAYTRCCIAQKKDKSWGLNRGPILDGKEGWLRPRNKEVVLAWEGEGRRGEVPGVLKWLAKNTLPSMKNSSHLDKLNQLAKV